MRVVLVAAGQARLEARAQEVDRAARRRAARTPSSGRTRGGRTPRATEKARGADDPPLPDLLVVLALARRLGLLGPAGAPPPWRSALDSGATAPCSALLLRWPRRLGRRARSARSGPRAGARTGRRRRRRRAGRRGGGRRSPAPAAWTWVRSPMSTSVSARAKSRAPPRSVGTPAERRARVNRTAFFRKTAPSKSASGSGAGTRVPVIGRLGRAPVRPRRGELVDVGGGGRAADPADVLLVLEEHAERLVDEVRRQLAGAEGQERGRPVERLGHPGHLGQVGRPQAADEADDLAGQPLGRRRHPGQDDLDLLGRARVVDPVVEAAPLEGVVDLARPVRGQDHPRRRSPPGPCRSRGSSPGSPTGSRGGRPRTPRRRGRSRR